MPAASKGDIEIQSSQKQPCLIPIVNIAHIDRNPNGYAVISTTHNGPMDTEETYEVVVEKYKDAL